MSTATPCRGQLDPEGRQTAESQEVLLTVDLSAITIWTAVAAVGTVGSLWLLVGQLWLLRRDRRDDYLRALIPFLSMDLYNDNPAAGSTPVRVFVDGRGIAYNVLIDVRTAAGLIPADRLIRYLREGLWEEVLLPGNLGSGAEGYLEIRFVDVFGNEHEGWQPVSSALGPLKTSDRLRWRCKRCRIHPTHESSLAGPHAEVASIKDRLPTSMVRLLARRGRSSLPLSRIQ